MNFRQDTSQPWDRARLAEVSEQRRTVTTGTDLTPLGYAVSAVLIALVCAVLLCLIVMVVMMQGFGASFWLAWRGGLVASLVPVGLAAWCIFWMLDAVGTAAVKSITSNGAGAAGDGPTATQHTTRIEVTEGRSARFLDIPMEPAQIKIVAKLALAGRLSERDMAGVMSRHTWGDTRRQLLDAGYVNWRNERDPRGGLVITPEGRRVFEGLLLGDGKHE